MSAAGLIHINEESRQNALKKVNEELIKMYWKVGEFLSKETEHASYCDAYIQMRFREKYRRHASEEDSRLQDYLTRLVKQIDEYDGENWIDKYTE